MHYYQKTAQSLAARTAKLQQQRHFVRNLHGRFPQISLSTIANSWPSRLESVALYDSDTLTTHRLYHATLIKIKEDAKNLTPNNDQSENENEQQQQPHGTATVSFVETTDAHLDQPISGDDDVPQHPISSLKCGDPSAYTVPIVVKMPDMTEDDDTNNIVEQWYKQPGDVIKRNDILCDITTPAFTFGMVTEDEEDAIMGEIHVPEGERASDNDPICTIYHLPEEEKNKKKGHKKDGKNEWKHY